MEPVDNDDDSPFAPSKLQKPRQLPAQTICLVRDITCKIEALLQVRQQSPQQLINPYSSSCTPEAHVNRKWGPSQGPAPDSLAHVALYEAKVLVLYKRGVIHYTRL